VFGGLKKHAPAANPTVFGREIEFEGDLLCSRPLHIRGRFSGSISSTQDIVLEKSSELRLERVEARRLVAKGRLDATSIEVEELEIHASARVSGSIQARSICVRAGACIKGRLDMESARRASGSVKDAPEGEYVPAALRVAP
jgi:cytoskeletal protein CcmA (bactofilin family)